MCSILEQPRGVARKYEPYPQLIEGDIMQNVSKRGLICGVAREFLREVMGIIGILVKFAVRGYHFYPRGSLSFRFPLVPKHTFEPPGERGSWFNIGGPGYTFLRQFANFGDFWAPPGDFGGSQFSAPQSCWKFVPPHIPGGPASGVK